MQGKEKILTLKATAIGSLPHSNPIDAINLVFENFKHIPFWPQLGKVDRHEDMSIQFLQGIPGIKFDENLGKYIYDSQSDEFFVELEEFFMDYEAIVNEKDFSNLDKYAITKPYTSSIPLYLEHLKNADYEFAKCCVTGPFTLSTSICDSEGVCAFYDETYREVLTKGLILKVVWQIQQIKMVLPNCTTIMFMDEPVMSQYGTSAFLTVKREDIVECISEIVKVVKDFGALSAVHCCGKSDWSVLIDTGIDILNFDAYGYPKSLGIYATEIEKFLKNNGYISWGLVPTLDKDALTNVTLDELEEKFEMGVDDLIQKSKGKITRDLIIQQSFFTPSCGAGGLTVELAQKAMILVNDLSKNFMKKYIYEE